MKQEWGVRQRMTPLVRRDLPSILVAIEATGRALVPPLAVIGAVRQYVHQQQPGLLEKLTPRKCISVEMRDSSNSRSSHNPKGWPRKMFQFPRNVGAPQIPVSLRMDDSYAMLVLIYPVVNVHEKGFMLKPESSPATHQLSWASPSYCYSTQGLLHSFSQCGNWLHQEWLNGVAKLGKEDVVGYHFK